MRKLLLGILVIVIVLSVGIVNVVAENLGVRHGFSNVDGRVVFNPANSRGRDTDMDEDGVCDNMECPEPEGLQENYGRGCYGENFVDADCDGVCDNMECPEPEGLQENYGRGCYGENFIDADCDGVCDNAAADKGYGQGNGSQCHGKLRRENEKVDNHAAGQQRGCGRGSHCR